MSSSYELCPAYQHEAGYLVIRRVEKAFPVFIRCAAAHFPLSGAATTAALGAAQLCATLEDFSADAARLIGQPALQPFEGGVPVLIYVARPGKEELFLEFADGLEQADDFKLLLSLPAGHPLALVFGDPSVTLSAAPAAAATPPVDPDATLARLTPVAPANNLPNARAPEPHDEVPTWSASDLPPSLLGDPPDDAPTIETDLHPQPATPPEPPPSPEGDPQALPPVEVVVTTTSALDNLLRTEKPGAGAIRPPAAEQPGAATEADGERPEPDLEILLRQAPRLQAPDTELGPVHQLSPEAHGPVPDEVLAAVRQVVGALDDALRRQSAEHQAALQAVILSTEQAVERQGRALEARQAEQWERQQALLRQMNADQSAAIQNTLTRLEDDRAAWQQRALRELQQTSSQQLPGALRQLQDDLAARQQQALTQLREDLLSRQPPAPAPSGPLATPGDMQELNWQLEKSAVSSQDLRQRVGQLLWVNVLLLLGLVGLALAIFWLLRGSFGAAPVPTATVAPTATAIPPTEVPPTPIPPTDVPPTATLAATATTAATALPAFLAAISCANTDRPRNFYDCELTNAAAVTDTLAIAIQPLDEEFNGFRPLVLDEDQSRIQADAVTGLFPVGPLGPGETVPVRVMLPCALASGCAETTFAITPLAGDGQTIMTDQVVEVTTHYFPP